MRRRLCLYLFLFLAVYCFFISLQRRKTINHWGATHLTEASTSKSVTVRYIISNKSLKPKTHLTKRFISMCKNLRNIILKKSLDSIKPKVFNRFFKTLRTCPWKYNRYEHNKYKLAFGKCCNAQHMLLVTQDNAPLGRNLTYETNPNKTIEVNEEIFRMLPKITPFLRKPFSTCAVVGNGGILQNSSCGEEIDSMNFVFRLNLPPLNLVEDIGTRSHLVTANPSILIQKFERLYARRKPFIELVKGYGPAMIILPAFSYSSLTELSFRALYTVEDFDLANKVAFFHPQYLGNLSSYWREMGVNAKRLSSGLMLVSAAIELCSKVNLYGFWPFSNDTEGNVIPHHYYDDVYPKPGFHSMPDEFYNYMKMHAKGALHLQVGKC